MTGVVLHIGFAKTGTTSIQHWLRDHAALLSQYRVRFPRGWLRLNNHFELPLTLMRLDRMMNARRRADEWRDADWRLGVLEQISIDLDRHRDELTVLSAEDLSLFRYDDEVGALRELIGDAEVVAYLRRPEDFLASMSTHYQKEMESRSTGMPGLSDDPDAFNYLRPDSWRVDYDALLSVWRRNFSVLTTVDYDAVTARDGSVVPSFLHQIGVPVEPDALDYHLNRRADAVVPRALGNRTIGLRFGEIP